MNQPQLTEQQIVDKQAEQWGIEQVDVTQIEPDQTLVSLVSRIFAKRNQLVPIAKQGSKLIVAMANPLDLNLVNDLRMRTGFQIERKIATKAAITYAIKQLYGDDAEDEQNGDSPIITIVNQFIAEAVALRASDIHIEPLETQIAVRFRVDGWLQTQQVIPKTSHNAIVARIKIMSQLNITETRIPQDGRCRTEMEGHPIDLRVSTLPTVHGEKIVLRILDMNEYHASLSHIYFHPKNQERFLTMIEKPTGVILITGPTGAGKTSTLHAALRHLHKPSVSIVTVEDPVEYRIEGINQVQVNPTIGYSFAVGLRAILRQDPNIIMIGEIRDRETAEIAIRASLTGHLVLSSIHTNDSISTITRLIDMGVEPFLVAAALSGIVSQRLVRQVCKDCSVEHPPTVREQQLFKERNIPIGRIRRESGCVNCNQTGYRGRIAIHEVLVIDDELRRFIMNRVPTEEIKKYATQQQNIFLLDDGLLKVKEGLTTTEEILRVV